MLWLLLALLGTIAFAAMNVADKTILTKYVKNSTGYVFLVYCFQLVLALVLLVIFPLQEISYWIIGLALVSGAIYLLDWVYYMKSLSVAEVSRAIPLYMIFPIFSVVLSHLFLKETITLLQFVGIFIIILGALLLSVGDLKKLRLGPGMAPILIAAFLYAVFGIMQRYVLGYMSYWNATSLSVIGGMMAITTIAVVNRNIREEAKRLVRIKPVMITVGVIQSIAFIGLIASFAALSLVFAPLVAAVEATQPFFVILFSLVLTMFFPKILKETFTKTEFLTKMVSTLLIVVGVAIITLV